MINTSLKKLREQSRIHWQKLEKLKIEREVQTAITMRWLIIATPVIVFEFMMILLYR